MGTAAERGRAVRNRRRERGLRELTLAVPDARRQAVRARIAKQVARLEPRREAEELRLIEAISEFDAPGAKDA